MFEPLINATGAIQVNQN